MNKDQVKLYNHIVETFGGKGFTIDDFGYDEGNGLKKIDLFTKLQDLVISGKLEYVDTDNTHVLEFTYRLRRMRNTKLVSIKQIEDALENVVDNERDAHIMVNFLAHIDEIEPIVEYTGDAEFIDFTDIRKALNESSSNSNCSLSYVDVIKDVTSRLNKHSESKY